MVAKRALLLHDLVVDAAAAGPTRRAVISPDSAKITFDEGYPAMAVTPAGRELLREWSDASEALGLGPVTEAGPMTRGAGDISFVASYVPGLVGVGAMGKGSHAEGETIFLDSVPSQAKRNAVLMERLAHQPSGH